MSRIQPGNILDDTWRLGLDERWSNDRPACGCHRDDDMPKWTGAGSLEFFHVLWQTFELLQKDERTM
jgi:hypothetical protein